MVVFFYWYLYSHSIILYSWYLEVSYYIGYLSETISARFPLGSASLFTAVSRPYEPSGNTLQLYNYTPFSCTTIHPLVVRLYTLYLYDYIPFSCTTIHLVVVRLYTFLYNKWSRYLFNNRSLVWQLDFVSIYVVHHLNLW